MSEESLQIANAAYVMGQTASALITAMGMMAKNQQCVLDSEALPYNKEDFDALIMEYGIHHNATIDTLFRS